jgi:hypothetical protein
LKFISAGEGIAQEKEIRLTLEFPFSQANFFDLIPRNCLSYFIVFSFPVFVLCMYFYPQQHFFVFIPSDRDTHSSGAKLRQG